jgi:hypothetical protein
MLIIYFREEQGQLRRDGVWGTQLEISGGRRPSGNIEDIAEPASNSNISMCFE